MKSIGGSDSAKALLRQSLALEQEISPIPTQCSQEELDLGSSAKRKRVGAFDGGAITSDGGVVLLGAADRSVRLVERLADCFTDHRHAGLITHETVNLLRQRIFGLALGYEDLIDHDALRHDPALTAALDKPEGTLAGKSTLNRLEHAGKIGQDRHHKLDHDTAAIERLAVDIFLEAHRQPPRIVLDLDATDDPLYGEQEGRHVPDFKTPMIIEDRVVDIPAISASAQCGEGNRRGTGQFVFASDVNNAVLISSMLQFSWEKQPRTERVTRLVAAYGMHAEMEQSLKTLGACDVYGLTFDLESANLKPVTKQLVTEIATMLKNNSNWRLQIAGHTDSTGGLSTQRAAAVRDALIKNGIAAERLTSVGYGESKPKADNGTLEGRAINRRVEFRRTDR